MPQLLAQPGVVDADTKSYLYLDPGRFLGQSASMWDPTVGLGTVTHQQIGYLFPMGPFFWAAHALAIPTWVAERLWVAAILFAAGAGVLFLGRTLRLDRHGLVVASAAFMLSPYFLQYVGRISVILLPWAALPWLLGLTERALRSGRWRHPALMALVVAAMSSVNASSAFYVGLAPLLWLAYAGATALHPWRRVWNTLWHLAALVGATSAWWLVGLAVEGGYGIDILKYTETVPVVSSTSMASEVLRGLGYWYFYGGDEAGAWVPTLAQFTQQLWVLAAGYSVVALAFTGAFVTRWRHRAFFVVLGVVGLALAVGAAPFAGPSPFGQLLRGLFTTSSVGLALRSTDRATPLLVLAIAMLLGAAVSAVVTRSRLLGLVVGGVALGLVVVANPAVWNGTTVPGHFTEPATLPSAVRQAATALDARNRSTRVLAIPGENFAAYRFGDTVDPLWPALLNRPFVTREQQVLGSLAGEDLLYGLDGPMQDGTLDPATIAPLARLLGAGDVLVQNDLAYERYGQPDPSVFWSQLSPTPPGLSPPEAFGVPVPNVAPTRAVDESTLALPPRTPPPPPLAVLGVRHPRPLVRAEPVTSAVVVDGDGVGLVDAAAAGVLGAGASSPVILYAGSLDTHGGTLRSAMVGGARLVLTDTNRRQAFRWNTIQAVAGRTLAAGERQPSDPNDAPLDIFPGAPADAQSTTVALGVTSVTASSYGSPLAYLPEDRPLEAIDGNLDTAWEVGPFLDPRGQWWQVALLHRVSADQVTLMQAQGDADQWITAVTLRFDSGASVRVDLGPGSRTGGGQVVTFPERSFRRLRVTIDATNLSPKRALGPGVSPVGLAEVSVAGTRAEERVSMPEDLLRAVGRASISHRLTIVMTRLRVAPVPPRQDPEPALDRQFWLPTARTFTLSGQARIDALIPDADIDRLVGRPGTNGSGVVAYSLGRLPGDRRATASAALDGDSGTWWSPGFGASHQAGQWISVHVPAPVTFDHLDLQVVADGEHSVPTALRIATERGSVTVALPAITDGAGAGDTTSVPLHFAALTGRQITVTFTSVRLEWAHDYYSGGRHALPLAVAELGIPGVRAPQPPPQMPAVCRSDLLRIDGRPVSLRVSGTTSDALGGLPLAVAPCGRDQAGITLGPGRHSLVAMAGHLSGLDLDQLVLDSTPATASISTAAAPTITAQATGASSWRVRVGPARNAFWLVLGESINPGWQATMADGRSLGAPQLVDGFADGWLVNPSELPPGTAVTVTLRWTPQSAVDLAMVASSLGAALCLVLVAWRPRRRRPAHAAGAHMAAGDGQVSPVWALPLPPAGARAPWVRGAIGALGTGAVVALLVPGWPWWGLVAAALVALGVRWRGGRLALMAVTAALVLATAAAVVALQVADAPGADGNWPSHFTTASTLAWLAAMALVADLAVVWVRRRQR